MMQGQDEEADDNSCECIICMSELRDTLILPCRHLCLCKICADNLRYQANNCPICRAPFIALLRVKAVCKTADRIVPAVVSTSVCICVCARCVRENVREGIYREVVISCVSVESNYIVQ